MPFLSPAASVTPRPYDCSDSNSEPDGYRAQIEGELTFGVPASFDAVKAECHAARSGVAIFDQSCAGKFTLRGSDATEAVQVSRRQ